MGNNGILTSYISIRKDIRTNRYITPQLSSMTERGREGEGELKKKRKGTVGLCFALIQLQTPRPTFG